MSPQILPSDTEYISITQSKHLRDDHVFHAFTVTVFLINFRPKLPHCHDLQMTGSKYPKRGISYSPVHQQKAYQKEYLLIGYDFLSI